MPITNDFKWLDKLAPDFSKVIKQRYLILQRIAWLQPVGRRLLAQQLKLSERVLRTETDVLRSSGLILSSKLGMVLTETGRSILTELSTTIAQLSGFPKREAALAKQLNIDHVTIVSGDSDQQAHIIAEMGQRLNQQLQVLLPKGCNIIAAMGGTTMAAIAQNLTTALSTERQLLFVPARGGVGESVDIQANTICSQMAQHTNGKHRSLYVPEDISAKAYEPLLKEPSVKAVLDLILQANVVLHSIGDAMTMAARRNMTPAVVTQLQQQHAVAEAFGYFFDESGRIVYKIPRIGLQLRDLAEVPYVFALAGGHRKATAIRAYMKNAPSQTWLFTDEGAANLLLKGATF